MNAIEKLWQNCKARDFITGDGQRIMVTKEELEDLMDEAYASGQQNILESQAF